MHKAHRDGIDTRLALLNGLKRVDTGSADASGGINIAVESAHAKALLASAPAPSSEPLWSPPAQAKHTYWLPKPVRRFATHVRKYFTEQLRHDLYVHVDSSTTTIIARLVAENQETRAQIRRLSAKLDHYSLTRPVTEAEGVSRSDSGAREPGVPRRPESSKATRVSRGHALAFAINDTLDEIVNGIETLRRDVARTADALQEAGMEGAFPKAMQVETVALSEVVERIRIHQTAILLRLNRASGDNSFGSAGQSR